LRRKRSREEERKYKGTKLAGMDRSLKQKKEGRKKSKDRRIEGKKARLEG